jgi:hypothetical protein
MANGIDRIGKGLRKSARKAKIKDMNPRSPVGPAEAKVHKGRLRSKTAVAGNASTHNSDVLLREGKNGSAPSTKQRVNDMLGKSQKGYLNRVKHARKADAAANVRASTSAGRVASGISKAAGVVARVAPHPIVKIAAGLAYAAGIAATPNSSSDKPNTRGSIKKRKKSK